jgi:ABC-type polysaccharide/polyol phosphate transport system ATPase subunit
VRGSIHVFYLIPQEVDLSSVSLPSSRFGEAPDSPRALEVSDVTVSYRSYQDRPTSLKEAMIRMVCERRWRHYSLFNALQGVSLSIPRGSVFGIIGGNGSGKSTLLKVLSGVLRPTTGVVHRLGSIASLIELGAGFDPELNAVENLYLHGSLHRKSRAEIRARVEHILAFAELTEFARTPVKYFSSGMYARLGFSAAIDIDPDILIVDEILGVGDERFQGKCNEVFRRFMSSGKTIVIVSHNMKLVRDVCATTAVLSCGRVSYCGETAEAIRVYREPHYLSRLRGAPETAQAGECHTIGSQVSRITSGES